MINSAAVAHKDSTRRTAAELLIYACVAGVWFPAIDVTAGPVSLNICELSILVASIALFGSTSIDKMLGRWTIAALFGLLAMAVLTGLQLLFVDDARPTFGVFLKFALSTVFVWLILTREDSDRIARTAIKVFIVMGSLSLLISNLDYFVDLVGGMTYASVGDRRSSGFFQHANQYAIWIVSLVPFVILMVKNLALSALLLCNIGLALLLTGSKFNLAVFFVIVWFAVGLRVRIRFSVLIPLAVPVFAIGYSGVLNLILTIMGSINPSYAVKVQAALEDPLNANSFIERVDLWNNALRNGLESPILGIGGGQAYTVLAYPHAHNLLLQYFLTYGLLGLTVMLSIFICSFGAAIDGRAANRDDYRCKCALILSLSGIFISNQLSDSMASQQILLFGIVVGLTLTLYESRRQAQLAELTATQTTRVLHSHDARVLGR
ncbi:O-antigen ligase family protein [Mycolicibacterium vaccae]|uniref:O-antigen ligase family protein n=1 Tax=Mycolicibacterium vaccae TaxID=1810 RepID=UPI003CEBF60C